LVAPYLTRYGTPTRSPRFRIGRPLRQASSSKPELVWPPDRYFPAFPGESLTPSGSNDFLFSSFPSLPVCPVGR